MKHFVKFPTFPRMIFILCVLLMVLGINKGVGEPLTTGDGLPSVSSPIVLNTTGQRVWVVNPDADSVTAVDTETLEASAPITVGQEPWAIALTPDERIIVMNRASGSLTFISGDETTEVPIGAEPGGLALSPTGRLAYVTLSSANEIVEVDTSSHEITRRVMVKDMPWTIAVTDDGDSDDSDEQIIVTHRFPRLREEGREGWSDGKEGVVSVLSTADLDATPMAIPARSFGYPNALEGLAIHGDTLWISHQLNKPEPPHKFDEAVSAGVSTISLSQREELPQRHLHINAPSRPSPINFPSAIASSPDGARIYAVASGSNKVIGFDVTNPVTPELLGYWAVGKNPRGIVLSRDGQRAYAMNYLSRDMSVLDLSNPNLQREVARVPVVDETLEPQLLRGKILFNNASDPRLSLRSWISCASCHVDGGVDGTSWQTSDGFRQTMPLWNLTGTAPFHIDATRDEVQDFEHDIRSVMGGIGLVNGQPNEMLAENNSNLSEDLDALAFYVLNGIRVPHTESNTELAEQGRVIFKDAGCAACHGGATWSISTSNSSTPSSTGLYDVGTLNAISDNRGEQGFDVPTLLGLHATAPYLHDGSAPTLEDVLANEQHMGRAFTAEQVKRLIAFLNSIDGDTPPVTH